MIRAYVSRARSIARSIDSCARRHFYRLFGIFFSLQLHPIHVCTGRDTVRVRICSERDTVRDSASSRDHDVAAIRIDIARLCCPLPLSPCWPFRRLRTRARPTSAETVTHRLFSLFCRLFPHRLLLRIHAHADLGLGFHCCLDDSCGGSLAQSRISRSDAF